jgi:hypothetical protein
MPKLVQDEAVQAGGQDQLRKTRKDKKSKNKMAIK